MSVDRTATGGTVSTLFAGVDMQVPAVQGIGESPSQDATQSGVTPVEQTDSASVRMKTGSALLEGLIHLGLKHVDVTMPIELVAKLLTERKAVCQLADPFRILMGRATRGRLINKVCKGFGKQQTEGRLEKGKMEPSRAARLPAAV